MRSNTAPVLNGHRAEVSQETSSASFSGRPIRPSGTREERVADAIAKLRRLREGGITTIVEPTAFGLVRNIERVPRINAEVDLNVIVASGVYA